MHRYKDTCPSKLLSTRELENAVIEKIKELSQDRNQLEETLKNANFIAQKEKTFKRKESPFRKSQKEKRGRNNKTY
jgi:hypothetical protein